MKPIDIGGVHFEFRPMAPGETHQDPVQFERMLFDTLEREYPALWQTCYPRVYSDPRNGQYYSSKKPARQLMLIALKVLNGQVAAAEKYEFHLASHLSRFRVPMYWLSPNLAEALKLTQPPGAFDWYNMPMPFEAGVIMMPKGSLVHKTDGDVSFICWGRFRAGETYRAPLIPGKPYTSLNGGMMLAAAVASGYFIHWNIPLDAYGPRLTLAELQHLIAKFAGVGDHSTAIPLRDGGMKPADHELGLDVAHFIFSTLMLMTARPDLVTAPSLTRRIPAKKGTAPKEFWNPAIIGEHYKVRSQAQPPQGGSHASPRFHWVQGFWREQPYGPQRELRKTIWIEPFTRGGAE